MSLPDLELQCINRVHLNFILFWTLDLHIIIQYHVVSSLGPYWRGECCGLG
jgi:hypothetical protein